MEDCPSIQMPSNSENNSNSAEKDGDHGLASLLGTSSFMFVCRVAGAGLAFLTQLLLARWMGAHELGIYVYAFSWLIILTVVVGIGYEAASFRIIGKALMEKRLDIIKGYIVRGRQILFTTGLISTLLIVTGLWTFDEIIDLDHRNTLLIALITIPFYLIAVFHESVSHAFSWFVLMILPNTVIRPLLLLIFITGIWLTTGSLNAETVMSFQLLAIILVIIGHYVYFRPKLAKMLEDVKPTYETRSWIRIGLPQLIPVIFLGFLAEINIIMIGFFLPADQVAIFSIAFRVAMLISFMIFAIDSAYRPKAALLYADQNMPALQKLTVSSTRLMFWPGLLCITLFIIFGEHILGVFGEEFLAGYEEFSLIALSQLITVSVGPVSSLLNVTGHQDYSLMVFGAALFILLILDAILIPKFGMTGAAIAVVIVTAFWNIWMLVLVKKHLNIYPTILSFFHRFNQPQIKPEPEL